MVIAFVSLFEKAPRTPRNSGDNDGKTFVLLLRARGLCAVLRVVRMGGMLRPRGLVLLLLPDFVHELLLS